MNIVQIPENYAPAFREVVYVLESSGGAFTDVEVYRRGDAAPLGAKRFADGGTVRVNVAGYLRRCFRPEPFAADGIGFSSPEGRSVRAYIKAGETASPERTFLPGIESVPEFGILSGLAARELRPGENDEISIVTCRTDLSGRVEVTAKAGGPGGAGEKSFRIDIPVYSAPEGVAVLSVSADAIAAAAHENGTTLAACRSVEVKIFSHDERVAGVGYRLLPCEPGSVRLCWLNARGGIDYYTFGIVLADRIGSRKERILGTEGYRTVSSQSQRTMELASGYLPSYMLEALSGVMSSPKVWMAGPGGEFTPVDVVSDTVTVRSASLSCLKLEVRGQRPVNFQNF